MFLRRYVLKFQQHMRAHNYSERTVVDYAIHLKFFGKYLEADGITELNQITRDMIAHYQTSLLTHEPPLALETQYARITPIKSLFRYLYKTNQAMYDPSADIELPKRKRNLPRSILTTREAKKLLRQPNVDTPLGLRDKAILEVLYSTGIRNQELRNLTIYDVDTVTRDLIVRQGKGKKDRVIPIGEIAGNYIDEYVKYARPELIKERETKLLFITKNGYALNAGNLIWTIRKYVKKAKIDKNITPHPIRHTCATHLLKNKADLRHIQELLGHESIETTQIYTQVEVSDLKKVHKQCHPRERG